MQMINITHNLGKSLHETHIILSLSPTQKLAKRWVVPHLFPLEVTKLANQLPLKAQRSVGCDKKCGICCCNLSHVSILIAFLSP